MESAKNVLQKGFHLIVITKIRLAYWGVKNIIASDFKSDLNFFQGPYDPHIYLFKDNKLSFFLDMYPSTYLVGSFQSQQKLPNHNTWTVWTINDFTGKDSLE